MPIYRLNNSLVFPPVDHAEEGILAVGGDLSAERLLLAYKSGIFPWYSEEDPLIWWAPDPRFVLLPEEVKVSKSMKQLLRKKQFEVTFDTQFEKVIRACADQKRSGQEEDGTWITAEMFTAYVSLYKSGYAHSVEVWEGTQLVGGLYGVALGSVFFGESMFFKASNASKYGFITLVNYLRINGFTLIDCQIETDHLGSLGAINIPRTQFMQLLKRGLSDPTKKGTWNLAI